MSGVTTPIRPEQPPTPPRPNSVTKIPAWAWIVMGVGALLFLGVALAKNQPPAGAAAVPLDAPPYSVGTDGTTSTTPMAIAPPAPGSPRATAAEASSPAAVTTAPASALRDAYRSCGSKGYLTSHGDGLTMDTQTGPEDKVDLACILVVLHVPDSITAEITQTAPGAQSFDAWSNFQIAWLVYANGELNVTIAEN